MKNLSNKELKDEYNAMSQIIDVAGCFGTIDARRRDQLEKEIINRGGEIQIISRASLD